jgi:two-component system sensor histidine kinase/response regulator
MKSRILVVDDVTKNLQVVGTVLRNEGYEVMPAASGAEALKCVRAQLPDLILLDLMMPDMDGLEVCRRLKADTTTRQVPVIFLTASNETEHLVQGFEMGAVDFVTKPFNPPELLARVRTHLELERARQRLREMNEEKNEFMGIAAHDLRSPLTVIRGYTEMMLLDVEMPREKRAVLLHRIDEAARRMVEMVQNLLDVNAIERGEMNLKLAPVDLSLLLSHAVEVHRPRAAAKEQSIHLENETSGPVTVLLDTNLTAQVIENLLSNAVKYSPAGKNIYVRLRKSTDSVQCEVRDEGPGLSADDQKRLFSKFARLSAKPTGGEQSTGLGLSIVKRMVEAMHGRVWCESEPGQGAKFVVQFPAAANGS